MRNLISTLGVTSLLLTALFGVSVYAADSKTVGGHVCKAYFGNQQHEMWYNGASIQNKAADPRWVTCPLVRDTTDNTNGLNYVRVWIKNQSPKVSRCSLRTYSPEGSFIDGDADQGQGDANLLMSLSSSVVDGTFALICYMPPGARVVTIRHEEW